jgi:hypothetical protein
MGNYPLPVPPAHAQRVFIDTSCIRIRTILKRKKPKAKIARCSGMGKFCPPAAALPESHQGNTYAANSCAIRGGGGGEVIDKNGRGAHLPRPKSFSCCRASFLKAREAPLKKRKRSETARPQFWFWIKIRVNPIYQVIFFMVAPPTQSEKDISILLTFFSLGYQDIS